MSLKYYSYELVHSLIWTFFFKINVCVQVSLRVS
jgi:hypothetical protein